MTKRALCLLALVLAVPAAAGAGIDVRSLDTSGYPHVRLTVVTSSPTGEPALLENGRPAAALRVDNLGREKSIALLVDRSRSMVGRSLADAVAAARTFIGGKTRADRIAVVSFGSSAIQLTGFSSSPDEAETALKSLAIDPRQGTALYDAVTLASSMLAREPNAARVILLVTDGRDVSSRATFERAVAAARAARAAVYAVGIEGPQFSPDALAGIAARTGGVERGAASSQALPSIYSAIARELRRTWSLDYVTAGRPGDRLKLVVTGDGKAKVGFVLPGLPEKRRGSLLPSAAFGLSGAVALAAAVALLVLVASGFVFASGRSGRLQERLAPYLGLPERKKRSQAKGRRPAALRTLFRLTERTFAHTRQWRAVQRTLDRADLPLRAVELVYVALGLSIGLGLVFAALGASPIVSLVAFAIGGAAPFAFVSRKASRRAAAFEAQLPDLLMSLASTLKAGHSFKQGLQSVVDEGIEPTGQELKRVLAESQLGRPVEESLTQMAERLNSKNFGFIVTAVNIQNQVGGSLAGLFDNVADTVRQRQQFTRKIRALTAMGRMSAYVLLGLPLFVGMALTLLNPQYMAPLFHSSTGRELIFVAAVMMVFGGAILRKIVSFRG